MSREEAAASEAASASEHVEGREGMGNGISPYTGVGERKFGSDCNQRRIIGSVVVGSCYSGCDATHLLPSDTARGRTSSASLTLVFRKQNSRIRP